MRATQRGQSLVVSLFVLMVGSLSLLYVFSTGQVSADKQRVTNAADAAAYSSALWRARVLNFDAYSNRAMIANEVAIAQTLTFYSEIQFLKNFAACFALDAGDGGYRCETLAPYILEIIGAFFGVDVSSYFADARDVLEQIEEYGSEAATIEIAYRSQAVNRGLSLAQQALHASTNFFALQNVVARQVTLANDDQFAVRVVADNFYTGPNEGFARQYTGDSRDRLANIARASLDPYSRNRRFDIGLPVPCIGIMWRKRGTTELSPEMDRWEASDNLSEWKSSFPKCDWEESPISWASHSAEGGSFDMSGEQITRNERARDYSRDDDVNYDHEDSYIGIPSFFDLNYEAWSSDNSDTDPQARNPKHKIALVVRKNGGDVRTANVLNIGVGRLRMQENYNRGRVASLAAAEVYFRRPPRADGRVELPSLFNPYWHARLAEPDTSQRVLAEAFAAF